MRVLCVFILLTVQVGWSNGKVAEVKSPCRPGDDRRLPHPEQCQLYFDCRLGGQPYDWLQRNLVECPYPLLFDTVTSSCAFFTAVVCGNRHEPINGCEYINNQCNGPNCRSCFIDLPECKGLPDGPNPIKHKKNSPFFAICYQGRFLKELSCPEDDLGKKMIYDSDTNTCVKNPRV